MCGRYAVDHLERVRALVEWLKMADMPPLTEANPRNIPPTVKVPVIMPSASGPEWQMRRWQMIPPWVKDLKQVRATFNARCETVAEKPSFRNAVRRQQRCVFVMSAYYENQQVSASKKQAYRVEAQDELLLAAGLYEQALINGETIHSCTMLTQPAPAEMAWLHPRMPVWLSREDIKHWIDPLPSIEHMNAFIDQRMPYPLTVTPLLKYGDPAPSGETQLLAELAV